MSNQSLTSATIMGGMYSAPILHSVKIEMGQVEIVWRAPPSFAYTIIGPNLRPPDKVWKEIWQGGDGTLVRLPDVIGEYQPERTVPEQITFPT